MPPRYAYWTIIVDNQPTAFRSSSQEELMPTFKRLKAKNDTAVMMWWQNGKLWPSRVDAQEAMIGRGEAGRRSDPRQAGSGSGFRDRGFKSSKPEWKPKSTRERSAWTPRGEPSTPAPERNADNKLDWKPKGEFVPAPKRADRGDRPERSEWKPKGSFDRDSKPAWKSKPSFDREERPRPFKRPAFKPSGDDSRSAKPEWKPKGSFTRDQKPSFDRERKPGWKPKGSFDRESKPRGEGLEWKPKGEFTPAPRRAEGEKRKWVPKEEYKKSMGIEAKRDSKWRPGGEHKDPKQKYKDAKKAKWTKFKQNIRSRSGGKGKKPS
jgi:23S rRNA pseudouridine2605 synthase